MSDAPRVLLVDDNPVSLKLATLMLERQSIRVDIARDGETAVKAVQKTAYQMVLMDVQLPGMDGIEATRRIRALESEAQSSKRKGKQDGVNLSASGFQLSVQSGHIPIIALTAEDRKGMKQACLNAGMDDVMEKPVRPEKIQSVLKRFIGGPEAPENRAFSIEDAMKEVRDAPIEMREEAPVRHLMTFTLGNGTYAFDLAYMKKIRWAKDITPVPGLPPYILGITNTQGEIISVVDLKTLLGIQSETPSRASIMIAGMKGVDVGLLVDSVDDLIDLPLKSIDPPMITFEKEYTDFIDGEARLNDRLVVILNYERIMASEKMNVHEK